jgi:CubicO group peptidase (beta-lactamase class C family)
MEPALTAVKLTDGNQPHRASGPGDADPLVGTPISYGFGWFLDPYQGHARRWHYGDTVGFKTVIERFTENNLTIIVLCNRTDLDAQALTSRVADLYLNR